MPQASCTGSLLHSTEGSLLRRASEPIGCGISPPPPSPPVTSPCPPAPLNREKFQWRSSPRARSNELLRPPGSRRGATHLGEGTGAEGEQTRPADPLRVGPPGASQEMWPRGSPSSKAPSLQHPSYPNSCTIYSAFLWPTGLLKLNLPSAHSLRVLITYQ